MRSCSVLCIALAMAAVTPVMSAPAPALQARDIQNLFFPQDLEGVSGLQTTPKPINLMGLGPEISQSESPELSFKRSSPPESDEPFVFVDPTDFTHTLNEKRDIPAEEGNRIEERSFLESFLNNPIVKAFSDASSYLQMAPVMDAPKGL